ncbi:hypothetical protein Tco_0890168 [Tanacetum coccineum]
MDLLSFIQTADPIKVRVGERQHAEDEPKLLDATVGRVVPLLPIAPAHAESELDASVDKLFDEGGSGNLAEQGDSAGGGHVVGTPLVSEAVDTIVEDVAPLQPKRPRKRKTRLLAGAVLNLEVGVAALPTLPFITSSVSVTPERESEDQTDYMVGLVDPATTIKENFVGSYVFCGDSSSSGADYTIGGFSDLTSSDFIVGGIRTVISPDTDLQKVYVPQWSVTNGSRLDDGRTCREMVDEFTPPKFSASIHGMDHDQLFTEFNVGAARQISLSAEVRMRAEYNIRERRRLNYVKEEKISLLKARDAEIESLKAQLLVKEAEAAKAIRLSAETSKFEAIEKSLQDEVRVLKDCNTTLEKEKSELNVKVADLAASVKVREQEAVDLEAMVTSIKSQNDNLIDQVHRLETSSTGLQDKVAAYENLIDQLEKFQDEKMAKVNEKFDKLCADFVEMALHLEEKFYPHLLTTISGHWGLLTRGMKLDIAKCLNSTEYLSVLGEAIGKAVEKGMHKGLSAGITHGSEGRKLTDVVAYNPSAKADYLSALQRLQSVNFSLIGELKSNKDASVDTIMNLLRLEDTLAERLGLTESQPNVNQLMVPIHHSPDQRVIGATALSLSLDVSNSRVRKIRENIANHISALRGVFVPLSEPLSAAALEGTEGTPGAAPDTTTALSVTFISSSAIPPISTDDYEVAHADGQESAGADGQAVVDENVNPFPNIDGAELNIPE